MKDVIGRESLATELSKQREVFAFGFSPRKRALLRSFIAPARIRDARKGRVPSGAVVLVWGGASVPQDLPVDINLVRVEDGFLRSVGLGAAWARPMSWVFDRRGIYFDATCASDLEELLANLDPSPEFIARARALRARLFDSGITKYSVGREGWKAPVGRRVILVTGQVESDASLRLGAPGINTNLGLLRAVRAANPTAYVVYKPHPDVTAGLRAQGTGETSVKEFCDEVVFDVAMGELLKRVDEVHVMTSLSGFEALLRDKSVTCYGLPFYAGWGLTHDILTCPRRARQLTVDELVAGALIMYPTYTGRTSPERVLEELVARRAKPRGIWQGLWTKALALTGARA